MSFEKPTKDHFYPRAIYKWAQYDLPEEEYRRLRECIEKSDNILKVCRDCNYEKQERVMEPTELFVTERKRIKLERVRKQIWPYYEKLGELKKRLLERQGNVCYCCRQPITDQGIIRRIDPKQKRTPDNGCVVCVQCNDQHDSFC